MERIGHLSRVAAARLSAFSFACTVAMNTPEVFQRITESLGRAGIAYMLTGSFASAHYGAPRSTQDIDLVIEATTAQVTTFVHSLPAEEYYADLNTALEALRRGSLFNVIDLSTGWKIDLIFRKSRPFSEMEFSRRQTVDLQGIRLYIASVEDVIVAKLEWAKLAQSQRQIEDVASMLRLRSDALDVAYLGKWITELGLLEQWNAARRQAGVHEVG